MANPIIDEIFPFLTDDKKTPKEKEDLLNKLLDRAYEIREFEIKLFWQRALYFWGLIAGSFAAYFAASDITKFGANSHMKLLVACIGFILSFSWYLVNRASSHWKENWESIIDLLEDRLKTPLYLLNIQDMKSEKILENLFRRKHFRISFISTIVCLFICMIWVLLILSFLGNLNLCPFSDIKSLGIITFTVISAFYLFFGTQINKEFESYIDVENINKNRVLYKRPGGVTLGVWKNKTK